MGKSEYRNLVVQEAKGEMNNHFFALGGWKYWVFVWGLSGAIIWLISPLELISILIATLIPLIGLWVYYMFLVFRKVPEEIHEGQKKTIENYQDKTLKIKLYDFQIGFHTLNTKTHIPIFEILAKNIEPTKKKIVELEAKIETITQYALSEKNELLKGAYRDGNVLEGADGVELRPDTPLPIKIATYSDDYSHIEFGQYNRSIPLISTEAVFNVKIDFSGKLEGETEFRTAIEEIDMYANSSKKYLTLASIELTTPKEFSDKNLILIEKYKRSRYVP